MTYKEVIALQLKGDFPPALATARASNIVAALHAAGYVIIRDRTDPEGGIPGRNHS